MVIFGYLIGIFICDTNIPLREGARTLPRPVINPEYDADWDMPKAPAYIGETMNQMIDKYIGESKVTVVTAVVLTSVGVTTTVL